MQLALELFSLLNHFLKRIFLRTINYTLPGPFLLVKTFLPAMKEAKKGLIINISRVLGEITMAGAAAYSASKFGLVGMMQSIR